MAFPKLDRLARQCALSTCSQRPSRWKRWLDDLRGYTFENRWYCAQDCLKQALIVSIGQLLNAKPQYPKLTHRAPLGLLMLSKGIVDQDQLREALKAQRESGAGRVGEWLRHLGAVTEEQITQTLGLQWSLPVFPLAQSRRFLECAHLVPFPLLEIAEMLPVHHLPDTQHLYVAFADRINHSALYAVEKVLDCHTEPCLAVQSQIAKAFDELKLRHRPIEIVAESSSNPSAIADSILEHAAEPSAPEVRISSFESYVWARVKTTGSHIDLLFQTS